MELSFRRSKAQMKEKKYSMEEAISQLDSYIEKLESIETPLSEAFDIYNDGIKLIEYCNKQIDKMEHEIEIIKAKKEGEEDEL